MARVHWDTTARYTRVATGRKTACGCCGHIQMGWYDRKVRRVLAR
jgi:hypothetical protein